MPSPTEVKIRQLCDSWVAAAQEAGDNTIVIGNASEQYRLHRNGIVPHVLTYDEIQTVGTSLSRVLLLKGLNAIIDHDHELFWAWIGEILLSPTSDFFPREEREIKELFATCIRAALARSVVPATSEEEFDRQRALQRSHPGEFNAKMLVGNANTVLPYLAFPLLEAMLKKACHRYVNYSGTVLEDFSVPGQEYRKGKRKQKTCSSLRNLLFLLYQTVSDDELRSRIEEMRQHLSGLDNTLDPFNLVYKWRNDSLHGSTSRYATIGGSILNLAALIALHLIQPQYISRRDHVCRYIQRQEEMGLTGYYRDPWSYYPPY